MDLMYINSALVSAQNRQRFYAFNWQVEQPEDRGILLRDILETAGGYDLTNNEKSYALTTTYGCCAPHDTARRKRRSMIVEPIKHLSDREMDYMVRDHQDQRWSFLNKPAEKEKSCCITANISKGVPYNIVAEPICIGDIGSTAQAHRVYSCDGKSVTLSANGGGQGGKTRLYACPSNDGKPIYEVKDGFITIKDKQYPIKLKDGYYIIRKLTPIECERLQTLPDNYTAAVSNQQRYKGLGNGWTAEVIIHILNGALKDIPRDEEIIVLSMYDGIGTGRYCLDKMGFTNIKYYAYEIDKYAKQIATSNYPDIIQCGDAFAVREDTWSLGVKKCTE